MTMWACAFISTDGNLSRSTIVQADSREDARDKFADTLPKPSLNTGALIAIWRLGNYPQQWLVTPTHNRELGRQSIDAITPKHDGARA